MRLRVRRARLGPAMAAGSFDRSVALERLGSDHFDVLVIGGGITGVGVALDAAARGLRTALVERDDFASGTSSKSSKLVHGGLRYLQQKEFRLVYEALAERQRLVRNAGHLVSVLPFLIPMFGKDGALNKSIAKAYSTALWLYDLTGGVRIGRRHQRISVDEALGYMPTLRRDRLVAAFLYFDAQADDARLTLAVARTAALQFDAVVANHAPVVEIRREAGGDVIGATIAVDGRMIDITADAVVNATGVWSDDVRAMVEPEHPASIRPAKGIHITVGWTKVRNEIAAVLPVPKDRRSVFVVPWGDRTYIGTTDTDYDGPLEDPQCTPADVAYLLGAVNSSLDEPLTTSDVLGTWAGLRPLVAAARSERTADLSRRHSVKVGEGGLITVTGGKLTTYRKMAADTVDVVARRLGRDAGRSPTARLQLVGSEPSADLRAFGADVPSEVRAHLVERYGSEAVTLVSMVAQDPTLGEQLVPTLSYLGAEAIYAVRYEMARDLFDVLDRRTRARLLARDATAAVAHDVARLIGPVLGWNDARIDAEVERYQRAVTEERTAADLPETALDPQLGL